MPSPLNFRKRLGIGSAPRDPRNPQSQSGDISRATSPIPPPATGAPNTNRASPAVHALPATTANPAFAEALNEHIKILSPVEKKAFNDGSGISLEELMASLKAYDDRHQRSSYSRGCASRVQGFLTAVDEYLKPIAIMVGHSPSISSLVVGGVKVIVQLGLNFAAFFEKLTDMMDNLSRHLGYLSKYAESFRASAEVQTALSAAYRDLLEFFSGARKVFVDKDGKPSRWVSFRVFLRITWEPFEANFNSLDARFRESVQIVMRMADIVEIQRQYTREAMEATEKEDEERRKLLQWLSEFNFDIEHDTVFAKRHLDTGNWLIESPMFEDWQTPSGSSILWCYGTPGVGKSVLALVPNRQELVNIRTKLKSNSSLVLETLSAKHALDSRIGLAFVYLDYKTKNIQNPTKILSTILKQLARQKEVLPEQLRHFFRKYYRDAEFPCVEKIEEQLSTLAATFDRVFLVIDALDELERNERKIFLPIVTRLAQSSPLFKIFVTSRREADISKHFGLSKIPTIEIEARKVNTDIQAFVRHQVAHWDAGFPLDQGLRDEVIQALTSNSEGMFLWVKYQLDYIYEQPSARDVRAALCTLPADMNKTYTRILEKIESQVSSIKTIAVRALMWVVGAARPLSTKELAWAVSYQPECQTLDKKDIYPIQTVLDSCYNLLTADNDIIRPVHYSVQEFLTATTASHASAVVRTYLDAINHKHAELAQSCLQVLLVDQMYSQLSMYATCHFDHHLRQLTTVPERRLTELFDRFLHDEKLLGKTFNYRPESSLIYHNELQPFYFCLAIGMHDWYEKYHNRDPEMTQHSEALHFAVRGGSVATVQRLLEMGYAVNAQYNGSSPLVYASQAGRVEIVRFLLANGAHVNAQGGEYGNALQAATSRGNEAVVQLLLEKGADVNTQGGHYGNALQAATSRGNEAVVQLLLEKGADVNTQGGYYGNALQAAAFNGGKAVVQLLLEKGADVNAQGGEYGNALQAAAVYCNKAVVQLLLEKGADANAQGGEYGNALQAAAFNGGEAMVRLLLEKGAGVNAQGGEYGNALQAAAFNGGEAVVRLLLEKGADVNTQGGYYGNALQAAAFNGGEAMVRLLLEKGADVNAQGGEYGNALQAAAFNGGEAMVRLLLEKGADVNAQGGEYGNALQAAAVYCNKAVVQLLFEKGAHVNTQGGEYDNELQAAATSRGNEAVVQLLLEEGADVNAQGGKYGNALQAAAYRGNEAVVQLLLEKGADVNTQGGHYGNALQAAAYRGNEAVVQLLLEKGADDNTQGGYYGNALQAAAYRGNEAVVQLLLEKGVDVNTQGGHYGNALQAAAFKSGEAMVRLLLEKGADVNAQGGCFGNARQAAAFSVDEAVVQLLLEKGADVNAQDGGCGNALQTAAYYGNKVVVPLLLEKGADVNAQGGKYGNALQAAALEGNKAVVQLLLEKGADVNAQGGEHGDALRAAKYSSS
ncbi:ankyrin repeat-containing domain protein [Sphaerosporella brunnea]|uniref:Ankyrin repeat-containing domain protein n=1 Tax=Sphaerosporella brunnea TaxID=1250544 RepID=A0A5J5ETI0_9PEZI|nr:ankyrin repeat-containing domain protein [Sphaerosporella brunnea]